MSRVYSGWLQTIIDQLAAIDPQLKARLQNDADAICRCWDYGQSPAGPHTCRGGCPVHSPCWCERK